MAKYPNPNPYDFVPLEPNSPCRNKIDQTQGCYDNTLKTGILECLLKTETPLFIHSQQSGAFNNARVFYNRNGATLIPASSLKGLLSTVAEVVSNSCLRVLGRKVGKSGERIYEFKGKPNFNLYPKNTSGSLSKPYGFSPREFAACDNKDELCPCCCLFGMTEKQRADDARKASSLAGRVSISDALPEQGLKSNKVEVPRGNAPRLWHRAFYFDDSSKIMNGRKFYYHQSFDQNALKTDYGPGNWLKLKAVEGTFTFNIKFHNLTDDELAILTYTLMLEEDIRHHFGYGKPFGLGTVRISITAMRLMNYGAVGPARYLSYTPSNDWKQVTMKEITSWRDEGLALWKSRKKFEDSYRKFKAILAWPPRNKYTYPGYGWFRIRKNEEITLDTYQNKPEVR